MSMFGGKEKQGILGVDIGAGGIKIVELVNEKGRARLVNYAFKDRAAEEMGASFIEQPDACADLLKKMLAAAEITTRRAISGVPVAQVFSSVLLVSVQAAKKKELDEAIRAQARKIAPRPIDEMVLDYKVIEETPKGTKVLLTAAESVLVRKYVDIFKKAGLELQSLETEALALIRSLVGRDRSTVILVDMGAIRTSISVIEKGVPFVSRSIDVGGLAFTRAISEQLQLHMTAAEQVKLDVSGLSAVMPENGMPRLVEPLVATVVNELRYITNVYSSQQGATGTVEKIILTGGASLFPRLPEAISSAIGIKTYVGDPWARVVYPEDLRPVLEQVGPRFGVGVGLAMRDIE